MESLEKAIASFDKQMSASLKITITLFPDELASFAEFWNNIQAERKTNGS